MTERIFSFDYADETPQRLDKYLTACLPELSRTRLQNLIKDGWVKVNGETVRKAGFLLEGRAHLEVRLPPAEPSNLAPEAIPLQVVFENPDVLVINKPAGMVVHPSPGHSSGTLVHAVLAHAPEMEGVGGVLRPGVVHRLDRDTSGLILLARNDAAHHWLQDQFRNRQVHKVYLALVDGRPPTPVGRIEAPIGRHSSHRQLMAVTQADKGREAISEYRTLRDFAAHTLLEVYPQTGRTHQIRLHLKFIGCPVTGDTVYGRKHPTLPLDRHFLHAARLSVVLPGETAPRTFEAPLPADLQRILDSLE